MIPILIFILATILQIIFLNPIKLSDQMEYYEAGITFPNYERIPDIGNLRIGLVVPVALSYRIFGYSELSYYVFPIVCLSLLVLLTYYLGQIAFDTRVGIFAALAVLAMPGYLFESGNLLPDIPATMSIMTAFYLFFWSAKNGSKDESKLSKRNLIHFLMGVFSGWAYLMKEYFIMFAFVLLFFFLLQKKKKAHYLYFLAGLGLMVGLEFLFGLIKYGNPFMRFMAANPRETWGYIERDAARILLFMPRMLVNNGSLVHLLLGIIGFIFLIVRTVKKDFKSGFFLLWIVTVYGFFTFFGLLPIILNWQDKVLIRPNIFRYWSMIFPAIFISGFAALFKLVDWLGGKFAARKWLKPALLALILVGILLTMAAGFRTASQNEELLWFGSDHYLELRDFLANMEEIKGGIWVVKHLRIAYDRILPIYLNDIFGRSIWDGEINYLNIDRNFLKEYEIERGYVIVDRDFTPEYHVMPDYLANPPDAWVKVFESENGKIQLYCVNCAEG